MRNKRRYAPEALLMAAVIAGCQIIEPAIDGVDSVTFDGVTVKTAVDRTSWLAVKPMEVVLPEHEWIPLHNGPPFTATMPQAVECESVGNQPIICEMDSTLVGFKDLLRDGWHLVGAGSDALLAMLAVMDDNGPGVFGHGVYHDAATDSLMPLWPGTAILEVVAAPGWVDPPFHAFLLEATARLEIGRGVESWMARRASLPDSMAVSLGDTIWPKMHFPGWTTCYSRNVETASSPRCAINGGWTLWWRDTDPHVPDTWLAADSLEALMFEPVTESEVQPLRELLPSCNFTRILDSCFGVVAMRMEGWGVLETPSASHPHMVANKVGIGWVKAWFEPVGSDNQSTRYHEVDFLSDTMLVVVR